LFRAVDAHGVRILVPTELEELVRSMPEALGSPGDLIVLPASHVDQAQFLEAISMFGNELAVDKNIRNALELVKQSEAGSLRDDGSTTVMEGHILPTTLEAVILAIQSGKIWDEEFGPIEHISNIATIALLHDYIEKQLEVVDGADAKTSTLNTMLFEIKNEFGETIRDGVKAMTIPFEIEDETERRDQYTENIKANVYSSLIKLADRDQNHLSDIIKFATGEVSVSSPEGRRKMKYFAKTDRHLSEFFMSDDLPDAYSRLHNVVWKLAQHFGYKP